VGTGVEGSYSCDPGAEATEQGHLAQSFTEPSRMGLKSPLVPTFMGPKSLRDNPVPQVFCT
jgi:hypothetical protein